MENESRPLLGRSGARWLSGLAAVGLLAAAGWFLSSDWFFELRGARGAAIVSGVDENGEPTAGAFQLLVVRSTHKALGFQRGTYLYFPRSVPAIVDMKIVGVDAVYSPQRDLTAHLGEQQIWLKEGSLMEPANVSEIDGDSLLWNARWGDLSSTLTNYMYAMGEKFAGMDARGMLTRETFREWISSRVKQ